VSNIILGAVAVVHGSILGLSYWQPAIDVLNRQAVKTSNVVQEAWDRLSLKSRDLYIKLRSAAGLSIASTPCRDLFNLSFGY
jgi:hypothetical protein